MKERLPNIHPGEVLEEEFLKPFNISVTQLAKETHLSQTGIAAILKGTGQITADIALRLSKFFGTSAQFWLGLQMDYDLEEEKHHIEPELEHIHSFRELIPA